MYPGYHTQSMLPHNLWKVKVQICDKLRTRSTERQTVWCLSASQSLASRTSSLSIRGWRSAAAITATCSCRSSCCPWCATCQEISSSFNKTAYQHTGHATRCNFLSSQHPLSFLQICGRRRAPTLIRSIRRYGVTFSSECISRSCTALTNWRSVCWTFGVALAWTLDQNVTDDAIIDEWCRPKRLRACVRAKGGHFKQLL